MPALAAPVEVAEVAEVGGKKKGKKKGAKAARDATTREYKEAAAAEGAPPEMAVAPAVSAAFLRVPGLPPMVAAAEGTQAGQGGPAEGATRRGASPKRPIDLVAHSTGSAEVGAELGAVEARQDGDGATAARAAKRANGWSDLWCPVQGPYKILIWQNPNLAKPSGEIHSGKPLRIKTHSDFC